MNDPYEQARAQRSALERLTARIPGFAGFQDRELRRDVDKLQREHLAEELRRIKGKARELARSYTDAGQIGLLDRFARLERGLDRLGQSVRFADYGASGLFDPVKIGEPELVRLYEFDLALLDDLADLERHVEAVPEPGQGDPEAGMEAVLARVRALDARWSERETLLSGVARIPR